MSDLQIVLIVIGGLIIASVLVLNWWQERRFHQQVINSFSNLPNDALLDEQKLEVVKPHLEQSDDNFSIGDNNLDEDRFVKLEELNVGETLPEDISIDTVYTELISDSKNLAKESAEVDYLDTDKSSGDKADINPEVKPAQHNEIKAIFDEAFSHAGDEKNGNVDYSVFRQTKQDVIEEPALSLPAMLHAQMDLTAVLYLAAESTFDALAKVLNGLFVGYDKSIYVHVLDSNKQWVLLNEATSKPEALNQPISRMTCSMQLADRAGAVSRNTLNRFQLAVETLGLDIDAHVEWQSNGDALTAATALDAFCIDVDRTMGFHLVHGDNGAFTGTKLRGLAESQGLVLTSDGSFKYFDEAVSKQVPSFIMFNRDHNPFSPDMLRTSVVKAVSFQLDIPHVKHCAAAFNHMVLVARQMETGLNAVLVDDNNKKLGDMQIEIIRNQLKVIHATMLVRGIVPGSDSALRLFS